MRTRDRGGEREGERTSEREREREREREKEREREIINIHKYLRAADAEVENGRCVLPQLLQFARAPQRREQPRGVGVGGAARQELLEDTEHALELLEHERLALGRVGAQQPHLA